MKRVRTASVALLGLAAVTAGTIAVAPPAGAAKKPTTITVLVTNDDGVSAPGIDALVQALRTSKNTKVVVVAPATNQSGTGGKTTPGTLTTAAGDDRERLRGDGGAGLPRRHRHRRARPARREAERGDVGHQRRPEPRLAHRALGHDRRGQDGGRRAGSPQWPSARAGDAPQYDATGEARSGVAGEAPRRAGEEAEDRAHDDRQLQRAELPLGQVPWRAEGGRPRRRHRRRVAASTARPPARSRPPTSRRSTQGYAGRRARCRAG